MAEIVPSTVAERYLQMKVEERLIVAADFDPRKEGGLEGTAGKVIDLAKALHNKEVYIKVGSILRGCGCAFIGKIHDLGLRVFADLKIIDIPNTMEIDAALLSEYKPELLTVMCCAGIDGMRAVQNTLPKTKVLGVTILTSLGEEGCQEVFDCSPEEGVFRLAKLAEEAGLRELILSPKEIGIIKGCFKPEFILNTPGIRPKWSVVEDDDQSRVLTPAQAIKNGADRIVIGRPITRAKNPMDAVKRTLEEIEQGLADR